MPVKDIDIEAHGNRMAVVMTRNCSMPESEPKGSYHVDKEFVDASHPDQSGSRK